MSAGGFLLDSDVSVEEVLFPVSEQVGYDKLEMNRAVVVFFKDKPQLYHLIGSGLLIKGSFLSAVQLCRFDTFTKLKHVQCVRRQVECFECRHVDTNAKNTHYE